MAELGAGSWKQAGSWKLEQRKLQAGNGYVAGAHKLGRHELDSELEDFYK